MDKLKLMMTQRRRMELKVISQQQGIQLVHKTVKRTADGAQKVSVPRT